MARIFISHLSASNAATLAVAKWLVDSGWDDYFLDVSPRRGLAPGERWQEALKAAADQCEAVLFLISPAPSRPVKPSPLGSHPRRTAEWHMTMA